MDIKKLILELQSHGETMKLGSDCDYHIVAISGISNVEDEQYITTGSQIDGGTDAGEAILPRYITVDAECDNTKRENVIRFFNPKHKGKCIVTYNEVQRWIEYKVNKPAIQEQNIHQPINFTFTLVCPQPYFLDMSDFGNDLAEIIPQFHMPFHSVIGQGFITGYRRFMEDTLLNNKGHVETGIIAEFTASGTVENPKVALRDSGYVMVKITMQSGDRLTINTNNGSKRIELNGENVFHKIDRMSTFFQLQPGDNILSYSADSGYPALSVRLYYTPKYLGV